MQTPHARKISQSTHIDKMLTQSDDDFLCSATAYSIVVFMAARQSNNGRNASGDTLLNHIYKTIWNRHLQVWVVVSELARGRSKRSKPRESRRTLAAQPPSAPTGVAKPLSAGLLGLGLLMGAGVVYGEPSEWINASVGNWEVASNWSGSFLPAAGRGVIIDAGGVPGIAVIDGALISTVDVNSLTVGQTKTGNTLRLFNNTTLTTEGLVVVGDQAGSQGTIDVQKAEWSSTDGIVVGRIGDGTLVIRDDGHVVVGGR